MAEAIAACCTPAEIALGVDHYLAIAMLIDGGLAQQVAFDLQAFAQATGRVLTLAETAEASRLQLQANRWTYLGSGMTEPSFLATLGAISPEGRRKIENAARAFC